MFDLVSCAEALPARMSLAVPARSSCRSERPVDCGVQRGQHALVAGLRGVRQVVADVGVQGVAQALEVVDLLLHPVGQGVEGRRGGPAGGVRRGEQGVQLAADRTETLTRRAEGTLQGAGGRVQGGKQVIAGRCALAGLLRVVELGTGGAGDVAGTVDQRGGGLQQVRQRTDGRRTGLHPGTDVLHPGLQALHRGLGVLVLQVVRQARHRTEADIGDDLGEGLVDLRDHTVGTLLGDERRQRVLLLVGVELQRRRLGAGGVEGQDRGAEILREHDRGVVVAGLRALDGLVLGGDDPVDLVVTG